MEEDLRDFEKPDENMYGNEHVLKFLRDNKLYDLSKKDQLTRTAKLVSKVPYGMGRSIEEVLVTKKSWDLYWETFSFRKLLQKFRY